MVFARSGVCGAILEGEMKERDLLLFNRGFPRFWIAIEELGCLEVLEELLASST